MKHLNFSLRKILKIALLATAVLYVAFVPAPNPFAPPQDVNEGIIGTYLNGNFPTDPPGVDAVFSTVDAFPNVEFFTPFQIIFDTVVPGRVFVGEKHKGLVTFDTTGGGTNKQTILDLSCIVTQGGGGHGLMGFALHPEFAANGYIYTWYRTIPDINPASKVDLAGNGDCYRRLSRWTFDHMTGLVDMNSEVILINQFARSRIHTGGGMFFGPDGFLYVGVGDEGTCCEQESTQRIDQWFFGGILRLDVDRRGGNISHPIRSQPTDNRPVGLDTVLWPDSYSNTGPDGYFIPNDNPWQEAAAPYDTLEEFYAVGIRHPYTLSYDTVRNEIWEGDVGEASWEEINKVVKGANYEWPFLEAERVHLTNLSYNPLTINDLVQPRQGPVIKLDRSASTGIIGGFVYRGSLHPTLQGKYIFGDHATGVVWTIDAEEQGLLTQDDIDFIAQVPNSSSGYGIASFTSDAAGEVYIVKLNGIGAFLDNSGGKIYKLQSQLVNNPDPPALLSQTGAFSNLANLTPTTGLIPYSTRAELWSDGAVKKRWIALPNNGTYNTADEQIEFDATEDWDFPPGTVLVKHFELPNDLGNPTSTTRLETRFVVIGATASEYYTVTYKWRENEAEADLLTTSDTRVIDIADGNGGTIQQTWNFPSRIDCKICHTISAGRVLGLNTYQMNTDYHYESGMFTANQVATLAAEGMFDVSVSDISDYISADSIGESGSTIEKQVRSYLASNCSYCHHPGGTEMEIDLRFTTAFEDMNILDAEVQGSGSTPGNVNLRACNLSESEIYARITSEAGNRMPQLGVAIRDTVLMDAVKDWILDMDLEGLGYLKMGEVDQVDVGHDWVTINLDNNYTDPVVVAGPPSSVELAETTVRIRNVTSSSFDLRLDDWECGTYDEKRNDPEKVAYMVVESGTYTLPNGKILVAANQMNVADGWMTVAYPQAFSTTPAVLVQCITENEASAVAVRIDHTNTNTSQLTIRIQEQEGSFGHTPETVSWIAIEEGTYDKTGAFEAGIMSGFEEIFTRLSFQQRYHGLPLFIGNLGSNVDAETATLRCDLSTQTGRSIEIAVQEERCGDAEVNHGQEDVHYVAFERAGPVFAYGTGIRHKTVIDITAFLQGPYNMTLMDKKLNAGKMLPTIQPFDQAPWNYAGKREVVTTIPYNAVDWILVQIRDEFNPDSVLVERACFLDKDGKVLELDGSQGVDFGYLAQERGYVSIVQRNHLAVMTAAAVDLN